MGRGQHKEYKEKRDYRPNLTEEQIKAKMRGEGQRGLLERYNKNVT